MASFAGALRALNELKASGVVDEYAVAGAMALVFWTVSQPVNRFPEFVSYTSYGG